MIYLITHAEKAFGPNPSHTRDGISQIEKLVLPEGIPLVVMGTGARFQEIYTALVGHGNLSRDIHVNCSPFCGSADSLEANKKDVLLVSGTIVSLNDYIGIGNDCFDAWSFLFDLPDKTLLCAGGELMIALGLGDINEKGQLFELDEEAETGKKIS